MAALRRQGGDDPRFDLAEAEAAQARADLERQRRAAARAAVGGRALGAEFLVAQACLLEAEALDSLGRHEEAAAVIAEARAIYEAQGDRYSLAKALISRLDLQRPEQAGFALSAAAWGRVDRAGGRTSLGADQKMNRNGAATNSTLYRLRGQLGGREYTFELAIGEHRVGSSKGSDVRLPVNGVSREHALLTVTAGGLAVEDRSKNGTFVGGRRVTRAAVEDGARVEFGPLVFEVEEVEADDVELGLVAEDAPGESPKETSVHTLSETTGALTDRVMSSSTQIWLRHLEGFAERLFTPPRGDPSASLGYLVETLDVKGCCAVEWQHNDDPLVLGARGRIEDIPP